MTEKLKTEQAAYKIWKHPIGNETSIAYLGEFYPPTNQIAFLPNDLRELGFGPGRYSILAPLKGPFKRLLSRWQMLVIQE